MYRTFSVVNEISPSTCFQAPAVKFHAQNCIGSLLNSDEPLSSNPMLVMRDATLGVSTVNRHCRAL